MTLDALLPDPWPAETVAALSRWRQGHLIAGSRAVWIAEGGAVDVVVGEDLTGRTPGPCARTTKLAGTGYYAVVSQTCDISGEGPGERHAFVQVCPVRDISHFGDEKVQQVKNGEVIEYVWLTAPPARDAKWAVDLRASFPVSKAVLAGREPILGFASFGDEIRVGSRLAAKMARPALHDYLTDVIIRQLDTFLGKAKRSSQWCDDIEQLRLEVEGDPLCPTWVRLVVVLNDRLERADQRPLRDFWKGHKKPLASHGIKQLSISFRVLKGLSVVEYRRSMPIYLPKFGVPSFD